MNEDEIQEIVSQHFSELGPLGVAAGYVAAKGIGLTIEKIIEQQEAGK
jgi:hypothetical protein